MGKLFAAALTAAVVAWLGPMCASLPANRGSVAAPAAEPAPTPAPKLKPAAPPAPGDQALVVSAYRMKKMFPTENGKYLIPIYRVNRAAADVTAVRLTLIARHDGVEADRADNLSPLVLAPGSTGYYSVGISTDAVEKILDAPVEIGAEFDWTVSYRLEGSDARHCVRLRVLPRRRDPEGIDWITVASSRACPPK